MKNWPIILILILSLAGLSFVGYEMLELFEQDQLWGNRPLIFYIFLWVFDISIFFLIFRKRIDLESFLQLTVGGLLLALPFLTPYAIPFIFIGFLPLFQYIFKCNLQENTFIRWFQVFHFFMVWNIFSTYWVGNSAIAAGAFAIYANSFLMTLPVGLFVFVQKHVKQGFFLGAFIIFWISFEKLHLGWDLSWPWLTLGNVFALNTNMVQWYEITGVFGGTFWVLFVNILVFYLVSYYPNKQIRRKRFIQIGLAIAGPILLSWWMKPELNKANKPLEVVVIQPNLEPHYKKFKIDDREMLKIFFSEAKKHLSKETNYLLFPETSFANVDTKKYNRNLFIQRFWSLINQYPSLKVVAGVDAYRYESDPDLIPELSRRSSKRSPGYYYENYNAMIQLDKTQNEIALHKKSKFVPGAEKFPYQKLLKFMKPVVENLGGSTASLGSQPVPLPFKSKEGNIAPIVCYESIYGEYVTKYVQGGADFLFVGTNDGWWDDTPGHKQHLAFSKLRAIETRKYLVRSANSGISAIINNVGEIEYKTQYNEQTSFKGDIYPNSKITTYVEWGDIIARIAHLAAIVLLAIGLVKKIKG